MSDHPEKASSSRRQALKALAAATGAASLATLPTRWSKPFLRFSVMPVHAQASAAATGCTAPGALSATATWSDTINVDFYMVEPGGFTVHPNGASPVNGDGAVSPTTGATHGGDVLVAGTETITMPPGGAFANPGGYTLGIYNSGTVSITVAVSICTECVTDSFNVFVAGFSSEFIDLSFLLNDTLSGCQVT